MDEKAFAQRYGRLIEGLREGPGGCPAVDQLLSFAADELDRDPREEIASHLAACASCGALVEKARQTPPPVDDLRWRRAEKRLEARRRPWLAGDRGHAARRLAAVAALVVVAIGAGLFVSLRSGPGPSAPTPVSQVRGSGGLQPISPAGAVEAVEAFVWRQAFPGDLRFSLEVRDDDGPVWSGTVASSPFAPPPDLESRLRAGARYEWRTLGTDTDGNEIASTAWLEFRLAEAPPPTD